ncbi:uncharacterized protein [Manis javanica]|uniref:uncharacterized protein n=1 Tax=Manis javanica TaxID=9974 RepID=UPI003C6D7DE0
MAARHRLTALPANVRESPGGTPAPDFRKINVGGIKTAPNLCPVPGEPENGKRVGSDFRYKLISSDDLELTKNNNAKHIPCRERRRERQLPLFRPCFGPVRSGPHRPVHAADADGPAPCSAAPASRRACGGGTGLGSPPRPSSALPRRPEGGDRLGLEPLARPDFRELSREAAPAATDLQWRVQSGPCFRVKATATALRAERYVAAGRGGTRTWRRNPCLRLRARPLIKLYITWAINMSSKPSHKQRSKRQEASHLKAGSLFRAWCPIVGYDFREVRVDHLDRIRNMETISKWCHFRKDRLSMVIGAGSLFTAWCPSRGLISVKSAPTPLTASGT